MRTVRLQKRWHTFTMTIDQRQVVLFSHLATVSQGKVATLNRLGGKRKTLFDGL